MATKKSAQKAPAAETGAEEEVQIVISGMPRKLLARIDAMAKQQDRSRASLVRLLLAGAVEGTHTALAA